MIRLLSTCRPASLFSAARAERRKTSQQQEEIAEASLGETTFPAKFAKHPHILRVVAFAFGSVARRRPRKSGADRMRFRVNSAVFSGDSRAEGMFRPSAISRSFSRVFHGRRALLLGGRRDGGGGRLQKWRIILQQSSKSVWRKYNVTKSSVNGFASRACVYATSNCDGIIFRPFLFARRQMSAADSARSARFRTARAAASPGRARMTSSLSDSDVI